MSKDNTRLALWIVGIWGSLIIIAVGVEAVVHDGAIASVIVDTFSKVLVTLVAAAAGVVSVSIYVNGKVATDPVAVGAATGTTVSSPTMTVSPAPAPAAPVAPITKSDAGGVSLGGAIEGANI